MLEDDEKSAFEQVLRSNGCCGARARLWVGMLELYALPARRQFPVDVQVWLLRRGFVRREDPVEGTFWERPAAVEMEVLV